jgi:hypothetical protein
MITIRSTLLASTALCTVVLSSVTALAFSAAENFSDYTSTTAFSSTDLTSSTGAGTAGTGASGNGWLNGWRTASTSGTSSSLRVTDTSPVNSGSNYLSASLASSSSTGTLDAISVARSYDVAGGALATANAFSMSFDFRVDTINASRMSYDIFDNKTRSTGASSTNTSFQFRAVNGVWNYFDGSSTPVATTMAFAAGTTYSFTISLNPVSSTYSFTISDGTSSVSASAINFRASGFATDTTSGSNGGRWLTFTGTETTDTAGESTTFSMDNIVITTAAIPESSSFAALAGLTILGLAVLRRRIC